MFNTDYKPLAELEKEFRDSMLDSLATQHGLDPADDIEQADTIASYIRPDDSVRALLAQQGVYDKDTLRAMSTMTEAWMQANEEMGYKQPSWTETASMAESLRVPEYRPYASGFELPPMSYERALLNQGASQKELASMSTWSFGMLRRAEAARYNLTHPNAETLLPSDANNYARELGSDIKFERPATRFEVEQRVHLRQRKDELEQRVATYATMTEGRKSGWDNICLLASTLAGGIDPAELGASLALSVILPNMAISGVAKASGAALSAWRSAKAVDAVLKSKRFMGQAAIAEEIYRAASAHANVAKALAETKAVMRGAEAAEDTMNVAETITNLYAKGALKGKLPDRVKTYNKIKNALDTGSKLEWDSLGKAEKIALDALTFTAVDKPFIDSNLATSKQLGVDLYTEKDASADMLLAAGLGIGLPAAVRGIGSMLGITPWKLKVRKIDTAVKEIESSMADGTITPDEGAKAIQVLTAAKEIITDVSKTVNKPNSKLVAYAEDIQRSNITDETLRAQKAFVLNQFLQGNVPKLWMIPSFEQIFSNIDNRVLKQLLTKPVREVLGASLIIERADNGMYKAIVSGDSGLLGKLPVTAFTEEEAVTQLGNLYKGLVLKDEAALAAYQRFSDSYLALWDAMDSFIHTSNDGTRYIPYAVEGQKLSLKRKFVAHFAGDDVVSELDDLSRANLYKDITGEAVPDKSGALLDAEAEFEKWWESKTNKETRTGRKGKEFPAYVFVDEEGNKDGGASLIKYIDEMTNAAEKNVDLGRSNEYLERYVYSEEALQSAIKSLETDDLPADTNMYYLFGERRISFDELSKMASDNRVWKAEAARKTIEFRQFLEDPANKGTWSIVKRHIGNMTDDSGSLFKSHMKTIGFIEQKKAENYAGLRETLFKALLEDRGLQKALATYKDTAGAGQIELRAVRTSVRRVLSRVLRNTRYSDFLTNVEGVVNDTLAALDVRLFSDQTAEMVNTLYKTAPEVMEEPALAKALQEEALADIEGTVPAKPKGAPEAEETVAPKAEEPTTPDTEGTKLGARPTIVEPLIMAVDTALSRSKVQSINDMTIAVTKLKAMLDNPQIAAEVLTGSATQTIYAFKDAARSVESMTHSYGYFYNSLKTSLRKMDGSEKGTNLLDYFNNDSNKLAIQEARIKILHGEDVEMNSDAARVAAEILNHEASLLSSLRAFGSNYDTPTTAINRNKMRTVVDVITDDEISSTLNPLIEQFEKAAANISDSLAKTVGTTYNINMSSFALLNKIRRIGNELHRKLSFLALRDYDLDAMFDPYHTCPFSLNRARDILLKGPDSDPNFDYAVDAAYFSEAIQKISDALLGESRDNALGQLRLGTTSWVYKYLSGISDFRAVAEGSKAHALDAYDGRIRFKNADAEMFSFRHFGYGTMQESVESTFRQITAAKAALRNFGTRPIDMATELIDMYNDAIAKNADVNAKLSALAEKTVKDNAKDAVEQVQTRMSRAYTISPGAKSSVIENVKLACGLETIAPSAFVRVFRILNQLFSSGMLAQAGLKSLADYTTIGEGLVLNGLAERGHALNTLVKAIALARQDESLMKLVLASNVLNQEELLKAMMGDNSISLMATGKGASLLDKAEYVVRTYANAVMNNVCQMTLFTNMNKTNAALAIQYCIGRTASSSYEKLPKYLQNQLLREGIEEADWDFLRLNAVDTMSNAGKKLGYSSTASDAGDMWFVPQILDNVSDETWLAEMKQRGYDNITKTALETFKQDMKIRAMCLVETSSSEMVSLPSGRIQTVLRARTPKNSVASMLAEVATQYQSFGAALLYNTYGKRLANEVSGETGISILDLMNPNVRMTDPYKRWKAFGGLIPPLAMLSMSTIAINAATQALAGRIYKPIKEDGTFNGQFIGDALLGSMGTLGLLISALTDGVMSSGLHGGGFSLQIAPGVSNALRMAYRLKQPLTSPDVENRGASFIAALANEVLRSTGLKNAPVMGIVTQSLVGAWLDELATGSSEAYHKRLDAQARRGRVILPYEINPQPFGGILQN